MIKSPWAVLLCKFSNNAKEPYPRSLYETLFTAAGVGKFNMVDFFRDMSHGRLDLSGTQVFGWYTLDQHRSDYSGLPGGTRKDLVAWAKEKATAEGIDVSAFHSVVVVLNVSTDVFGSPNGVVCDDGRWKNGMSSLSPSVLGQEMAHGYSLRHSRREGSTDDYMDPWDIMSTAKTNYMAPHPVFTNLDARGRPVFRIGPGLNAANMAAVNWLDESRVWQAGGGAMNTVVELRPLHRRDLPGYLAVRFSGFFIEFRMPEQWDAGIGTPCVLVHSLEDDHSYLQTDQNGKAAFSEGSFIATPPELSVLGSGTRIAVEEIDASRRIARIRIARNRVALPQVWPKEGPWRNPWVTWSEDDAIFSLNGQTHVVPRRSVAFQVLEQLAVHQSVAPLSNGLLKRATQAQALAQIASAAERQHARLQFSQPAELSGAASEDQPESD